MWIDSNLIGFYSNLFDTTNSGSLTLITSTVYLLFKQQCQCLAYHPPTVSVQYSAKVMSYPSFLNNLLGRWEVFVPKQSEILYEITISLSSLWEYFSMFLEGYPKTLFLPAFFFSWLLYRTCCHWFPVQFLHSLKHLSLFFLFLTNSGSDDCRARYSSQLFAWFFPPFS